ncbi:UNVERIFIED_CONTAM: hypothetical protein FKN15_027087 [Acipenser sinensis]
MAFSFIEFLHDCHTITRPAVNLTLLDVRLGILDLDSSTTALQGLMYTNLELKLSDAVRPLIDCKRSEYLGKAPGPSVQRWTPSRSTRRDVNSTNDKERHDAIFRKVRGILNKLTPEKFDKLCLELLNVGVDTKLVLKAIILLIVDKALEEPKYSSLYAQLCLRLAEDAPNFDGPSPEVPPAQKQSTTFRRLLISKLQDEFENRTRNVEIYDKHDNPLTADEEEQRAIAKIKMLGNIKFIGELGKLDLIHESILHKCIKTLLEKKKRVQLKDMGEDLECLCQIMRTVGPRLDHEKAKIVDKALEEPKYSSLYAQLCLRLAEDAPNFDGPSPEVPPAQKQSTTFRRLLISKLQDEFENRTRNVEIYDKHDNPLTADEEEQRAIAKIKMLGNIKFIGELGKLDLIHESILHKCIKTLLEKKKRVQLKDMGEDLECLCQIMRTVGPRLDHEKAKDLGVFIPANMSQGMRTDFFLDGPFMAPRMKLDRETLGGLADMFGQMPGSGIGTGPGVIQDRFSPTMGRHRSNQLFNGHGGHIVPAPQSQFEMGGKSFMKSNQGQNQHYHTQNQGHPSQQQAQSKDMQPRFIKKGQLNADEISLRPAQSFLINKNQVPKLQPQIPTMIPPSAQPPRTQTPPLGQPPQLGLKTNPPPIQEKPAKNSKKPPAKEELLKMTETIVTEYLNSKIINDAVNDPSPQAIYKWIKDNISPKLHTDKGFVNILMTSFLQYISHEMCLTEGDEQLDTPSKEQLDQEKQLLLVFKPVMQKFLHDHVDLQVSALYALQVHCSNSSFPKGMLLRYFVHFYDMEIIEEEAFLAWKEDISQEFPGKGKALFQVNQWLTWLETAEEEESDDDAE